MGYTRDEATLGNWVYYQTSDSAGTVTEITPVLQSDNSNAMWGKQRNTFGSYLVVNKDKSQIEVYGYSAGATPTFSKIYTTTAEASVEYMGSHEFYWWPHKTLLMAKVSDGSSFRFYRMSDEFRTYAVDDSSADTKYKINSGQFRLFHVPGRTMVPPVFWDRWVYFYLSGT